MHHLSVPSVAGTASSSRARHATMARPSDTAAFLLLLLSLLAVAHCRTVESEPAVDASTEETMATSIAVADETVPGTPIAEEPIEVSVPAEQQHEQDGFLLRLPSHRLHHPCRHGHGLFHRRHRDGLGLFGHDGHHFHRRGGDAEEPRGEAAEGDEEVTKAVAEPDPDHRHQRHHEEEKKEEEEGRRHHHHEEEEKEEDHHRHHHHEEEDDEDRHGKRHHRHHHHREEEDEEDHHDKEEEGPADGKRSRRHDEEQEEEDEEKTRKDPHHRHHHHEDEDEEEKTRKPFHRADDSDDEDDDMEEVVRRFRKAIMRRRFHHGRRFFRHRHNHHHHHAEEAKEQQEGGGVRAWINGLMNRF
ncbi:hypothetical protein QOZ80_2BG0161800 [Eleusine coracana subsp. coracana]|nr:hypothetical protein QOZ80_2BG0161800 [Eleusine coracana subsp. coracana]